MRNDCKTKSHNLNEDEIPHVMNTCGIHEFFCEGKQILPCFLDLLKVPSQLQCQRSSVTIIPSLSFNLNTVTITIFPSLSLDPIPVTIIIFLSPSLSPKTNTIFCSPPPLIGVSSQFYKCMENIKFSNSTFI